MTTGPATITLLTLVVLVVGCAGLYQLYQGAQQCWVVGVHVVAS